MKHACAMRVLACLLVASALPMHAAERTKGQAFDDSMMVSSTKTALLRVAPNVASAVNVDVHRGRILLAGFLDSDKQKADALTAAAKVKDHVEIIDGLVVMPGGRSFATTIDDQLLQAKVKNVIVQAEGWDHGLSINTECKNGEVLLSGFVAKQSHRDAAGRATAAVIGVKKVHNFLTVKGTGEAEAAAIPTTTATPVEPTATTSPVP